MTAPTEHDLARQHGAPWAQQAIRDELMKMETHQYWPDHEAPDYGGLQGQFAPLWERFNARPLTRVSVWSLITIGALAGVAVAAWL